MSDVQLRNFHSVAYHGNSQLKQRNNVKFGSVNLVQVSKTAFKNPTDLIAVDREFTKAASKITGGPVFRILKLCGFGKQAGKVCTFLENPVFAKVASFSRKNKIPASLREPADKTVHSFFVLTKNDKNQVLNKLSLKNQLDVALSTNFEDPSTDFLVKMGTQIMDSLPNPEKTFRIDSLEKLPKVFEQIDY